MMAKRTRKVAIYLRVSTEEQTTANQRRELEEVVERHGWELVRVFEDHGISGAKGRAQRPGFDALLKAITRRDIDMVAAWSVDRLGRSLSDLVAFLQELQAKNADLYLHQQGVDTSTPSGRALFQMLGVFAEFERSMIRARVRAGLARAQAEGVMLGRPKGATSADPKALAQARKLLADGVGIGRAAKLAGIGVGTAHRLAKELRVAS